MLTMDRKQRMKHIRIEYSVGVVTLLWSLLSVILDQSQMLSELANVMPGVNWTLTGFLLGASQIYIARNSDKLLGTFWHWTVAFISAIFWCYLGAAAHSVSAGIIPVMIFWGTAGVTLWELGHVRP